MEHKFKVGDVVKTVKDGEGVGVEDLNKTVTITEVGKYNGAVGYKVNPAIGNTRSGYLGGFIGEETFELVSSLPEKWYIRITSDNNEKLKEWWIKNNTFYDEWYWDHGKYLVSKHPKDTSMTYNDSSIEEDSYFQNYREITAEQLLNQTKSKEMKTYKVTREQLAEIYSIACSGWKPKIEKITNNALGAFGTEGELSEDIVQSMRDAATTDQRPVIDRIFPKPKKKVSKEVVGYVNIYNNNSFGTVRTTKEEAEKNVSGNVLVIGHQIRFTYEVEEEC